MQLFNVLTVLATILSFASAATAPKKFFLKSELISGNPKFDGLYVYASHTGAGFNAALLSVKRDYTPHAFLNNSLVEFHLFGVRFPYRMQLLQPEDFYSGWGATEINSVTKATRGFHFDSAGHLVNNNRAVIFGGWRVCEWNHGKPELFHNIKGFNDPNPSSCALVHMVASAT